ncbi:MAG: hypothetical protein NZT92_09490 [Abditibacteriales bacterium]|nr:hypothetical protein [Abditibacteriales bacterium]MDW8366237.1 hypothetical protein [Abditibacteriales bacterium]
MIRFKSVGLMLIALLMISALNAQEFGLDQLIPRHMWARTGIYKLSYQEQQTLAREIIALLQRQAQSKGIAVIAPSFSTSLKAREIRARLMVSEVPLRQATTILVVVRSSLYDPLRQRYDCVCDLKKEADRQLNIAGPTFHVYLYVMDDDLRVTQKLHESFPAD